ncbi:hypothetical protein BGZ74_009545 [Mortierella antarctica]|nr:hypothetical protein BGZ74_009545 [Mortierella antarctica]
MTLDFTGSDPYSPLTSSDNIEANYHIPFAFPLNIVQVAEDMNIQLPQGNNVANLKLPLGPAQTISPGVLKTAYSNQPLIVDDGHHETFNAFSKILTTGPGVSFFLAGTADTVAETAAGAVTIPGVQVNVQSTLVGMNLNAGGAAITNISITGGTPQYLEIHQNVVLQNPSGLTVKVGEVGFNIGYAGHAMGRAVVANMVLVPGANTLPAVFHMTPDSDALRDAFLSGFVAGASFTLDVAGGADSTTVASLKDAMASVKLSSTIKGITDKLIGPGTAAEPGLLEMLQLLHPRATPVQVMIYNPFDTPLYIKHMTAINVWNGKEFGVIDQDVGMTIPAKSSVLSPTVTMTSPAGLGFMTSTILPFMLAYPSLLFGATVEVPFDITSTIVASVGGANGYTGNVQYKQLATGIRVTVGGKAPAGALPPALLPPTTNTTSTASGITTATATDVSPTTTATPTTAAEVTTTIATTATTETPSPKSTSSAVAEALTKRQVQTLQEVPESQDPTVVEAWLKLVVNKLALDDGIAAPFI